VTFDIYGDLYGSLFQAFNTPPFRSASIITTTGFVSADYEKWPHFSQLILLICMFLGAMAGSTGGGIKTVRVILMVKHSYQQIFRIIHPHAVTTVKLGGQAVPEEVLSSIWGFFFLYMGLFVIAFLVMASMGLDYISAISSVAATIGNIGPGLGIVGPVRNYLEIPRPANGCSFPACSWDVWKSIRSLFSWRPSTGESRPPIRKAVIMTFPRQLTFSHLAFIF
jgi:trk system potassium uptake protein TrkH